MDRGKASKLSDKIHNAVDEYLLSRDLPDLKASINCKRPQQDGVDPDTLDGVPMIKKSKTYIFFLKLQVVWIKQSWIAVRAANCLIKSTTQ